MTLEAEARRSFEEAHGIKTRHIATVCTPTTPSGMMEKLSGRIAGNVVVEIGAGFGVLAVEMAKVAKHVVAIECDPVFSRHRKAHRTDRKPGDSSVDFVLPDLGSWESRSRQRALRARLRQTARRATSLAARAAETPLVASGAEVGLT